MKPRANFVILRSSQKTKWKVERERGTQLSKWFWSGILPRRSNFKPKINKLSMNSELRLATENEAHILAEREQWREAACELLRVAKAEPRDAARWLQIAHWQRQSGDITAAAKTLETALKLNSNRKSSPLKEQDSIALWLALAEAQLESQKWQACITSCQAILGFSENHHYALEILATALIQGGDPLAAEKVMRELLVRSPLDPLHRLRLGTLLHIQGKLGEATREFERVINLPYGESVAGEVSETLENLEQMQIQQVLIMASERLEFRRELETDMEAALDSLGFYLSENGRETLQHTLWDGAHPEAEETPRLH